MAEFLQLPNFKGCKVAAGELLPPDSARVTHLSSPAECLKDLPPKTGDMVTAEQPCRKFLDDKEKNKRKVEDKAAVDASGVDTQVEKVVRDKGAGKEGSRKKRRVRVGTLVHPASEHVSSPIPLNHAKPLKILANEQYVSPNAPLVAWVPCEIKPTSTLLEGDEEEVLLLRIQLRILWMPLRRQSRLRPMKVSRLLALPTPPPSPLTSLSSPHPHIPSPPLPVPSPPTTSPTYTEVPLGYRAVEIRLRAALPLPLPTSPPTHHPLPLPAPSTNRRADILEADIPPQKRLLLTAPTPSFVDTVDASIQASERRTMAAIEMVNLRRDHVALPDEVDTLRRFEAHDKALEERIVVLKTQAYRHEWEHQDADDHATRAIVRIQALEARARVNTLEDTRVADALAERDTYRSRNDDDSHDSGSDKKRRIPVARECTYSDFLKCQPLNFKGTEGVIGSWLCCAGGCFPTSLEKYVGGLPDMIQGSVMASKPKKMQDAIEFATEMMDQNIHILAERQSKSKRKFEDTSRSNQKQQ
ncbi:hypothetical protein Tco_0623000, partial [Tanacetum coccineum]